jgi:hypothetical protein
MEIITNIQRLKELAKDENGFDGFILLNHGIKSSKQIWYGSDLDRPNGWEVFHYIDETEVEYDSTSAFINGEPNIIKAILNGALVSYA